MAGERLSDIGEDRLLAAIHALVTRRQGPSSDRSGVFLGAGDDAAILSPSRRLTIATTDQLLEGIDFLIPPATWQDIGWRSLAVNLSDIAAMGGVPRYALVSLALPPSTFVADVLQLYEGFLALALRTGVAIVGGDIGHSASGAIIGVTLLGESLDDRPDFLRRDAAARGDIVAVTGELGLAAAGLLQVQGRIALPAGMAGHATRVHLRPEPRLLEGQVLVRCGVRAGMDLSDGLLIDLERMCRASAVAAQIREDLIPVPAALRDSYPVASLSWALTGGEDFELLVTLSPAHLPMVQGELVARGARPLRMIGEIVEYKSGRPRVAVVDERGQQVSVMGKGYDHFDRTGET